MIRPSTVAYDNDRAEKETVNFAGYNWLYTSHNQLISGNPVQKESITQLTMFQIYAIIRRDCFDSIAQGTILLLLPNFIWVLQAHGSFIMPTYPCVFPINFLLCSLFIFGITSVFPAMKDPNKHRIMKYLRIFGDPQTVITQLNVELEEPLRAIKSVFVYVGAGGSEKANMFVTKQFVIVYSKSTFNFIHLSDIVWLFKSRNHAYDLTIKAKDGTTLVVRGTQVVIDRTLEFIHDQVPWVIKGYNKAMLNSWSQFGNQQIADRQSLIDQVEQRKKKFLEGKQ